MKKRIDKIKYTIEHRHAIRETYKELYNVNKLPLAIYLHDLDKIIMTLFIGPRMTSKIHKKYSRHHGRAKTHQDHLIMVADWESARKTKPDKQYNAFCTLYLFYSHKEKDILPILKALNICRPNMVTKDEYKYCVHEDTIKKRIRGQKTFTMSSK